MTELIALIDALRAAAAEVIEESYRLSLTGPNLNPEIRQVLLSVMTGLNAHGINPPVLIVGEESLASEDLQDDSYDGERWRMVLGKSPLALQLQARADESTFLFFSVEALNSWLEAFDPFLAPQSGNDPDFSRPTTIRVSGLGQGFGGPLLWVLPLTGDAEAPTDISLPSQAEVQGQIHLTSTQPLNINAQAFALTWGALHTPEAAPWRKISAQVLAASLVQDLKRVDAQYEITLRGTKRLSLGLIKRDEEISSNTLSNLVQTVGWVYEERAETRLKLVADRLSIDIEAGQSFLAGIQEHLAAALQQARDSYAFVILERKDAYHKEMRELMKDMKSQADLYASKIRDLVSALARDFLSVLVLLGFSFIAKFDPQKLQDLLHSPELSLLCKVLAGYVAVSSTLLVITQKLDAALSEKESSQWLNVLQHYTSHGERKANYTTPLAIRRLVHSVALWIYGALNLILALLIWNLPHFVRLVLAA